MLQFRDSISAICVAAAWADGQVSDFEKQALDRIHVQLGYSRPQVMAIIAQALADGPSQESVDIPYDEAAQQEFMRLALAVCLADGAINDHEINFLSKLANFLSVSPEKLEELKNNATLLLSPGNAVQDKTVPERLNVLLPEQLIKLSLEVVEENTATKETYDFSNCKRKPLSEILYQGKDYGGELSLL